MYSCVGDELRLTADYLSDTPKKCEIFPDERVSYVDSGRSATYLAIQNLEHRGTNKKVWMPRYVCSAITMPFTQLGYDIGYYSMGNDFKTISKLPDVQDGDIVLYIHYLGMKNIAAEDWITRLKETRYVKVIEDCVQSSLNTSVGNFGDYAVYSFRKFLPMPDGGALYSKSEWIPWEVPPPDEGYISRKLIAKTLGPDIGGQEFNTWLVKQAEDEIDSLVIPKRMSWVSRYILDSVDLDKVRVKRLKNWKMMSDMMYEVEGVNPLIRLREGEVPLVFPVKVEAGVRNRLYDYLVSCGIPCRPRWWPVYDSEWKDEFELCQTYLSLPINQDMEENDLKNVCAKIQQFMRKER